MSNLKNQNPISDYEKATLLPMVSSSLVGLYKKSGSRTSRTLTAKRMIEAIRIRFSIKISDARFRVVLYHISINGLGTVDGRLIVLVASKGGYCVTSDPIVVRSYRDQLQKRVSTQMYKINSIERDLAIIENRKQIKIKFDGTTD